MAAHNPTHTARLWVDYTTAGANHSLQLRYTSESSASAAASTFSAVLAANLGSFRASTVFRGARVAQLGSNVTNPVTFTSRTGTGGGSQTTVERVTFWERPGRSLDGSKVRYFLYGMYPTTATPGTWRVVAGTDARLDAFWSDFADFAEETGLVTIGLQGPLLHAYYNVGQSAYHIRQQRIGGS